MKRFLVVALAVIMSICALAMVGCGKGVSYEDFKAKAAELQANDPNDTKGVVQFKFGEEEEYGPSVSFEITDEGVDFDEKAVANYAILAQSEVVKNITTLSYSRAWTVMEKKNEKGTLDNGKKWESKVVYLINDELSVTYDYNLEDITQHEYLKYDLETGYVVEKVREDISGKVYMLVDWSE